MAALRKQAKSGRRLATGLLPKRACRLKVVAETRADTEGIAGGKMQLRYRHRLTAQLRFGVELRFVPLAVEHIVDGQFQPIAIRAIRRVEIEDSMPLCGDAAVLVGGPVADVAIAQRAFQPAPMPRGQSPGRGQPRRQRDRVGPRRRIAGFAARNIDIGVSPQP